MSALTGDDGRMDLVSKLADVDPVFVQVVDVLYGGLVDPREAWDISKSGPDASEVHVNRPLSAAAKKQQKKERSDKTQRAIALGTNAIGVVGGPAAIYSAGKSPALRRKAGKAFRGNPDNAGPILKPIQRAFKPSSKAGKLVRSPKALAAGAGGATLLQVGNMSGDAISVKYFAPKRKKDEELSKALNEIVTARRMGVIDDETAILMGEQLAKSLTLKSVAQSFRRPGDSIQAGNRAVAARMKMIATPKAPQTPQQVQQQKATKAVRNSTRTAVGAGAGAGAAGGATVGYQQGKRSTVKKSEDDLVWTGEIAKMDTDKRQVFGWCSVSQVNGEPVVDLQGDYIPLEEVEKAAYSYVIESRKGGDMHARVNKTSLGDEPMHTSDMIESFVVTPEKLSKMGLPDDALPHGWWVGFKVNDDAQWDLVKQGKRTGFSIHGKGSRVEKEL